MNALHKFVRAHPWLESTLRVAYWVCAAAIPILFLSCLRELSEQSYTNPLRDAVIAYRDLWRHDNSNFDWTAAPYSLIVIGVVAVVWGVISWLLSIPEKWRMTPLRLYVIFLIAFFLLFVLLVALSSIQF